MFLNVLRFSSSFFIYLKKDSMTALSQGCASLEKDWMILFESRNFLNIKDVYWEPLSEWKITACFGSRVFNAFSVQSFIRDTSILVDVFQAITFRAKRSRITHKYTKPLWVFIYVKSLTQTSFGWLTLKFWLIWFIWSNFSVECEWMYFGFTVDIFGSCIPVISRCTLPTLMFMP